MKMCYVDESGDTGPFDPQERNSQPIFLLCGLLMDQSDLEGLTREVINCNTVSNGTERNSEAFMFSAVAKCASIRS